MFNYKSTFLIILAGCVLICAGQQGDQVSLLPKNSSTTTSTTTTTTSTTSTTTPEPLTTTPSPAPFPDPSIGTWNSSCILIKMAAQLNFTYETKNNLTTTALYNIPADSKVYDSDCNTNNITQNIHLVWGENDAKHGMVLQFDKINNTAKLTMIYITLYLTADRFPDAKENQSIQLLHRGRDFSAPLQMSYHCTRSEKFNFTETVENKTVIGYVVVHDVQAEAFRTKDATGFSAARDCDGSETSDLVPIAVGIALAVLILIVLIAYLCARRRSTARGYMSF